MTVACYQTLYDSSIAFGMRKALQSEQNKIDLQRKIKQLQAEKREYEKLVHELQNKCDMVEKKEIDRRAEEAAKHKEGTVINHIVCSIPILIHV
jgi:dynein light intermediate chain